MSEIIGSTYEIVRQLGVGGGGTVYLARHLRLNKQVVLKVDRRQITTKPELLRREVDVLKDLKHPYIPQVYDFFSDGERVYTAMDYVDGESLDKALKRGERFSQAQVIAWGKQLLQALVYLHSPTHGNPPHGYVHSDIKPANLMLRTNGEICLIDFNITLARGEKNVIGASAGYASPEHYGLDYSSDESRTLTQDDRTLAMDTGTVTLTMPSGPTGRRPVRPDVRSDIYSTGATLYHLLSGRRPAKDAREVVPLSAEEASPQIAEIIAKAMNPNADLRYQTAAEMLWALEHLHENDWRTKRFRRTTVAIASILSIFFLAGALMTVGGLQQMERTQAQERQAAETARQAFALAVDSEDAYRRGDIPSAVSAAMDSLALESPYVARAQLALTEALRPYDLLDGFRSSRVIDAPSTPIKVMLSPGGTRTAVLTLGQLLVFETESGLELGRFSTVESALADAVFLGEDILFFAGTSGVQSYDLSKKEVLWTGGEATGLALSGDGSRLAAIYKNETSAVIYDAETGDVLRVLDFGEKYQSSAANDIYADPEDALFALDREGRFLAVSFADGSLTIFDSSDRNNDLTLYEASPFTHFAGGFCGKYFAFTAAAEEDSVFAVVDVIEKTQTIGFSAPGLFGVQADESGICVSLGNTLVQIDPETGEQTELAYTGEDIISDVQSGEYTMVLLEGAVSFFDRMAREIDTQEIERCELIALEGEYALVASRDASSVRVLSLEEHPEAQLFSYDASYLHSEARVGQVGSVMLFRYDGFQLYAPDGTLLAEISIPDADQVYDQQYRREEGVLEVSYYDGTVCCYSTADGEIVSQTQGSPPDRSLYEEFLTEEFSITAPLHERPTIFDRETGEKLCELETEDSLTYVTDVGGYLVMEYITAQGDRYGLLLDENLETLAKLPNLCDILEDGTLVFDDMRGNLRQSRIYSTQELIALGENYQGGT